ncbi:MAG: hypothetical protein ACFFCS_20700 [Candidatus Hodarchaeota archaeon]
MAVDEKEIMKKIDALMAKREKLEEICDTLPECEGGDNCDKCKNLKKMEEIDEQVTALEDQLPQDEEEE